jgi:DNA-binding response OmpR family regulator
LAVDVLIAEDEPSILKSLDFILRRAGWSIESVTDGDAALSAVRRSLPKVLVLDVMLPKRSGFDVLKHIRADAALKDLPVLILTAKGQAQDRRTAEELGAGTDGPPRPCNGIARWSAGSSKARRCFSASWVCC